jgi:hypothetical protein
MVCFRNTNVSTLLKGDDDDDDDGSGGGNGGGGILVAALTAGVIIHFMFHISLYLMMMMMMMMMMMIIIKIIIIIIIKAELKDPFRSSSAVILQSPASGSMFTRASQQLVETKVLQPLNIPILGLSFISAISTILSPRICVKRFRRTCLSACIQIRNETVNRSYFTKKVPRKGL